MIFVDGLIGNSLSDLYNSNGHRCKEISEINFQNYVLFAGDNGSLGLDKPLEETFPYIISHKLKCDYYNLSVFNGGLDALKLNLISWFTKHKKPKAVIITCEFMNSLLVSDKNFLYIEAADYNTQEIQDVANFGNTCGFFEGRNKIARDLLLQYLICPIYQLRYNNTIQLFSNTEVTDIEYNGDKFDYQNIAQIILEKIVNKNQRARP
jgi:hypothetical protein